MVFTKTLSQKTPWLQQKATAELPGCHRTSALQKQHVDKALGTKAGTSKLPVLDAWLQHGLILHPLLLPCTLSYPPGPSHSQQQGQNPLVLPPLRKTPALCQELSPTRGSLQSK